MNFREYLLEQNLNLPPIPPNSIRLTHFTSRRVADLIFNGQGFQYGHQLLSTTDPFSDNNQVLQLIQNGKIGPFERQGFGDTVVLIDLPNDWYRIHRTNQVANQEIPNQFITGFVDRNTMNFYKNPRYKPNSIPAPLAQTSILNRTQTTPQIQPQSFFSPTDASEVF